MCKSLYISSKIHNFGGAFPVGHVQGHHLSLCGKMGPEELALRCSVCLFSGPEKLVFPGRINT